MRRTPRLLAVVVALALLVCASAALARTEGYDLSWWTVDGGGGASAGGGYTLAGTVGQANAGQLTGGSYTLTGGFWGAAGGMVYNEKVYLPLVIRN